ncbi:MAG: NotI family restriction endonuclease [Ahrensia sp.]
MEVSEVFGFGVDNESEAAWNFRKLKDCPFRMGLCTKSSKTNPIGICSLSDGINAAALCPVRFLENDIIFKDAARIAFGDGAEFAVFPEVRILKIASTREKERERKIGKVDFLIGLINGSEITDFAAVEVQAVYFSGNEIRSVQQHFLDKRTLEGVDATRRPDFRSSAQKRLIPQLELKVPVFRRWGKKFFVVVDQQFFAALPEFKTTTQGNSEVTWLAYPLAKKAANYSLGTADIVFSAWDEIRTALREGDAPEPDEIYSELNSKFRIARNTLKVLTT